MIEATEQDARDLQACGLVARGVRWRELYYALKDAVLQRYGAFDGLVLQVWSDPAWLGGPVFDGDEGAEDFVWAEHRHILMQYHFCGLTFHVPADEFDYWNMGGIRKRSAHYQECYDQCLPGAAFLGKKRCSYLPADRAFGFAALKRLVRRHRLLLIPDRR